MRETRTFSGNSYRSPPALAAWLAQADDRAIDTELAVIDSHHHIWDNERGRYLLPEFLADLSGNNVVATVFLECGTNYAADVNYWDARAAARDPAANPALETAYIAQVAEADAAARSMNVAAGIVGFCNLTLGADSTRRTIEAHIEAGRGRFRGVRQSTAWDSVVGTHAYRAPPPGVLLDPRFRAGFAELGKAGLTFDSWIFFPQILDLVDLAHAFPDTTIVLNHFGGPLNVGPYSLWPEETFAYWRRRIDDIAGCPNVVLKLGGLGMLTLGFDFHLSERPAAAEALAAAWRPFIEYAVDAFGPERCLFDSNFPVDSQSSTYTAMLNAYKIATRRYTADERRAIFAGTANRVYRLGFAL